MVLIGDLQKGLFSVCIFYVLRKKAGLEILAVPPDPTDGMRDYGIASLDFKRVAGGLLVETQDTLGVDKGQLQVVTQVRTAARNVKTNQQRVQSARASRELQEKKLEAEEKKLAAGMSSPFFVVQAQRDLSLARTVEIQAISDYNKSLVDFEAVQQVPINGGGNQVQVAR